MPVEIITLPSIETQDPIDLVVSHALLAAEALDLSEAEVDPQEAVVPEVEEEDAAVAEDNILFTIPKRSFSSFF
tara:strand:- start:7615 stop:7836 length:222 start_codon:yes stop_codon:yes gene_type:complete